MDTKIIKIDTADPDLSVLSEAANFIKAGELVAFPTETVYGLGANALEAKAVEKIFRAKGRPQDNPLIVHVSSIEMARGLISQDLDRYSNIVELLWPGPVTLIFRKNELIPQAVTAGLKSVGIRLPANPVALKLIELSGLPIAAPSANLSGKPSPTSEEHVLSDMEGKIACIILSGDVLFGLESTIVDLSGSKPALLRPGPVDVERIKELLPELVVPPFVEAREEYAGPALSPGLKYRHYSPDVPLVLIEGNSGEVVSRAGILARRSKSILLCSEEYSEFYPVHIKKVVLGSRNDLYRVASNLFRALRNEENRNYSQIIAESFPENGIGLAIMNRLRKAASRIERV